MKTPTHRARRAAQVLITAVATLGISGGVAIPAQADVIGPPYQSVTAATKAEAMLFAIDTCVRLGGRAVIKSVGGPFPNTEWPYQANFYCVTVS